MDAAREEVLRSPVSKVGEVQSDGDAVAMRLHVKLADDDAAEDTPADALNRLQTSFNIARHLKGLGCWIQLDR